MAEDIVDGTVDGLTLETLNATTILKCHATDNPHSKEQDIHIVGTAHISKKSCDVVREVIQTVQPEVLRAWTSLDRLKFKQGVFLELCHARRSLLHPKREKAMTPDLSKTLKLWREGQVTLFEALYSWMLARFGSEMECLPGEEFRVAFEEAQKLGIPVMLGDRPMDITVKRMWSGLSFWEKCRLCWYLLVTGINIPDKDEILKLFNEWEETDAITEAIKELSATFPSIGVQLIDERNLFMIHNLREFSGRASTIVAVVGAGHLPGIKDNWESDIDIDQIGDLPEKKPSYFWYYCCFFTTGIAVTSILYLKMRGR